MTKNDLTVSNPALAFELVNVSVRMYRAHLELLERAVALKQAADPTYTTSDYIRETLALQAAIDLGVDVPVMPDIVRGRGGSLSDRAAARLGMSKAEFEQAAIRAMAAQALGSDVVEAQLAPRRPASGTYKRTSVAPERMQSTPPAGRRRVG
jgi:hypothetical protein